MRAILLLALPLLLANAPPAIDGTWRTDDGKALIRIGSCGAHTCGWVAQVLDRRPGVPTTDVHNPDPKLRNRPLLDLATLTGFTRDGALWTGGHAYDPKTGRSYRATLAPNPDGSLKVTGCVLIVCRSLRWTRAG